MSKGKESGEYICPGKRMQARVMQIKKALSS